jgi:glutamyl-Q tRNA(Asp) synthetase
VRSTTRFAPSPTGYLHLGHVVNAIYVWGLARAMQGRVLLRIEDHDRIRSRKPFEDAILDDLGWLGFVADDGGEPVRRQSEHDAEYARALDTLLATHHVFACDCSRKGIGRLRRLAASEGQGEDRYPGRCRHRRLMPGDDLPPGLGVRVQLDDDPERFDDLALGATAQTPAEQCGDLLLRDRDGNWTYQFAATVDDMNQGIDLVIRGLDLLPSTGRQIKLARMLGRREPPQFFHHPLILKPGGEKLSKASGDTGVRDLRAAGEDPEAVIGRAAAAVGLIPRARPMDRMTAGALAADTRRGR